MSSIGSQNPWAPYDNYKDCSQGICSIYCRQYCYLIFPPPPPSDDDSGAPFSPLIIAIIGVLTSAFLLVSYYTIVRRYCRRRNGRNVGVGAEESRDESGQDQWQVASNGLDEAVIKTVTVCRYQKGEGVIEGTECAVCLGEFQENESFRLLPKCSHAFHLPCIDTWLKSQANCPLCRAKVVAIAHPLPPQISPQTTTSSVINANAYETRRPHDSILVVDDQDRACHEHVVVVSDEGDAHPKRPNQGVGGAEDDSVVRNDEQYRRSASFGTFTSRRQLLISDILKFEDIDECIQVDNDHLWGGIGSSSGDRSRDSGLLRSPVAMKRSISTGGFVFAVHGKGFLSCNGKGLMV